ncbi:TPA: hypothetical protein DCQ44_01745, partial [Candidatus Taylorbacteria bacterium]|nr:hypothetical protein [Candidatus Taylorbacteria bacterium]
MFFTKKKNAEVSMVVDIGNSSVGVALVSVEKNVAPKILFSTRVHMPMQNKPERERKVLSVTSTLETVMSTVMSQHIPIQCSHIFFSAPWYISTTEVIKAEHETPQIFTHRTIEQITKGVESKLMHSTELKSELVERRIIRTKLNGYETSGPNNMKATSVEVVFYASLVSSDILAAVKRVIEKHFHIRHNQVSTFSLAAWSAITSLMPEYRDFFIVDVRGEETDVSLISNGVLLKNTSFSKGKNSLARSVSASAGQSHT